MRDTFRYFVLAIPVPVEVYSRLLQCKCGISR